MSRAPIPLPLPLPIDSLIPEILASLERRHPNLILKASPGTGKTTRVPASLLKAEFRAPSDESEILVLEPRRLAAKYAARRVAEEQGSRLGGLIGYQFRLENQTSSETRLRFLTEGMLMRRLLGAPTLPKVAAVVLDEFHERHLHGDVALAYLRHLQLTARPDLRIVVMSATLETETLSKFLGDAPILAIDARLHPVTIEHLKSPAAKPLDRMVAEGVSQALEKSPGDVLVFLPGMAEIRRAEQALAEMRERRALSVLTLHGELSRDEQDRAMRPDPEGRRKVILSTNLAETSLTIEGVTAVVDSGLHRIASYSWWSGVPTLRTRPVSRASAIQRAGRAGRTAPGYCLRLYTAGEFEGRVPFETPEIRRADLTQTVLELKSMGIADSTRFPWFEAPAPASLEASEKLLLRLGAADSQGALTTIGRKLAAIPAHPRLGRMLLEASRMNPSIAEEAALLAARISEGDSGESLDALAGLKGAARDSRLTRVRDLLLSSLRGSERVPPRSRIADLRFAVLAGFPDRVARKRSLPGQKGQTATEFDLVFSAGGSARVSAAPVLDESDTFVALDVQQRQGTHQQRAQSTVHSLCPIPPDWLFDLDPSPLTEITRISWDSEREAVVRTYQIRYDELVLLEEPRSANTGAGSDADADADARESAALLANRVLGLELAAVPGASLSETLSRLANRGFGEEFEATLARLSLVCEQGFGGAEFEAALTRVLGKLTRAAEVRALDWPASLVEDAELQQPGISARLERLAPTHFAFPGGRRSRIHYRLGQSPWVESRIQDFFGLRQNPAILGGKLPLTLHLLAPNGRAVQVTRDLSGFWERHYPEIRRELARRYPRHSWPENPAK